MTAPAAMLQLETELAQMAEREDRPLSLAVLEIYGADRLDPSVLAPAGSAVTTALLRCGRGEDTVTALAESLYMVILPGVPTEPGQRSYGGPRVARRLQGEVQAALTAAFASQPEVGAGMAAALRLAVTGAYAGDGQTAASLVERARTALTGAQPGEIAVSASPRPQA